ncbi:TPA: hypothetical protein I7730_16215 [Vibrio vulnificus]|uniref:Uncharacterized protein n=1 Tax=Vibrio vulnificus TaxID=672 RepID=A0A8H9TGA6_VIBVL|nr:hypothetical protein [Vibrio vulnificus]HAS8541329.1 hypothetical protein [Vibrio vulnificus]
MIVTITLTPNVAQSELHSNDQELANEYRVEVNSDVKKELIANVALDVFHTNVPIKHLDDFNFIVRDADGIEIEESAATQEGLTSSKGTFLGE